MVRNQEDVFGATHVHRIALSAWLLAATALLAVSGLAAGRYLSETDLISVWPVAQAVWYGTLVAFLSAGVYSTMTVGSAVRRVIAR